MQKLSEDEFNLLASKWHTGVPAGRSSYDGLYYADRPNTDTDEATKAGLKPYDYRNKRVLMEKKLFRYMKALNTEAEKQSLDDLKSFYLKAGGLYVQEAERFYDAKVILTDNRKAAKVFTADDSKYWEQHCQFKREAVEQ